MTSPVMVWRALFGLAATACGGSTPPPEALPPVEVQIEEVQSSAGDGYNAAEAQLLSEGVIASRRAGAHGSLPPLEQVDGTYEPDAWPTVKVQNGTPHGLVVWFSGPCPRTVALAPNGEIDAEFCEGTYDVAAELSAPNFHPFVGEGDVLEAGHAYSVRFFVVRRGRTGTRRSRR